MILADPRLHRGYGWLARGGSLTISLPQASSIQFYSSFNTSITAEIGTSATFTRASASTFGQTTSLLASKATNQPLIPEFGFGEVESFGGFGIYGKAQNLLLQSEDFTNAIWTNVGGGGASANTATDPFGTTLADTISGASAGDGKQQDSGILAASSSFIFSVYLKTSSGTGTVDIKIKDGGTQVGVMSCGVTTTWRRFDVFKDFASATGNCFVQILVGNSSNIRAFGAQLEKVLDTGTYDVYRKEIPSVYVTTGAATATRENDVPQISSAIADTLRTVGSVSLWYKTSGFDQTQFGTGNTYYLFSASGEGLALVMDSLGNLDFWIGAVNVVITNGALGVNRNSWTHLGATWDITNDVYKVYINGALITSSGTLASAWVAGSPIFIGTRSTLTNHWYCNGRIKHFTLWNTILSDTDMQTAYTAHSAQLAEPVISNTGKIFEVALGTSPLATTGTGYYRYTRASDLWYYNSTTSMTTVSDGIPATGAFALNAATSKNGMMFTLNRINSILQSEAITTTWTTTGTGTATAGVGTFLTNLTYGTLAASGSNFGIQQSIGTAAAGTKWVGSFYVQRHGGSDVSGLLTIEGDAGGTPETLTQAFTATSTVQRIFLYKTFTGSATGNVRMKITVNSASNTIRVGAMQLERRNGDPNQVPELLAPTAYIRTTTTATSGFLTQLVYESKNNINVTRGTAIVWMCPFHDEAATSQGNTPTLIGFPGHSTGYIFRILQNGNLTFQYDLAGLTPVALQSSITFSANVWIQLACSWDTTAGIMKIYKDGALLNTRTGSALNPVSLFKMYLGTDNLIGSTDTVEGLLDRVVIFGSADDSWVSDDWNTWKATYGR